MIGIKIYLINCSSGAACPRVVVLTAPQIAGVFLSVLIIIRGRFGRCRSFSTQQRRWSLYTMSLSIISRNSILLLEWIPEVMSVKITHCFWSCMRLSGLVFFRWEAPLLPTEFEVMICSGCVARLQLFGATTDSLVGDVIWEQNPKQGCYWYCVAIPWQCRKRLWA